MSQSSITIRIRNNRRAALLAGRILGDTSDLDVSPSTIGAEWPRLVALLDMNAEPPRLSLPDIGTEETAEGLTRELVAALEQITTREALQKIEAEVETKRRQELHREALSKARGILSSEPAPATAVYVSPSGENVQYSTQRREVPTLPYYASAPSPDAATEWDSVIAAITAENARLDAAALATAMPDITAEISRRKEAAIAAKAEKEAADAARFAARLASGHWEREMSSYNEKRYGAWWCARVDFSTGPKGEYTFGESTASWGKAGILRVACQPGDFIAYGQKDLRRPGNSSNTIQRMKEDGSMETFGDKADAYQAYKAAQKA